MSPHRPNCNSTSMTMRSFVLLLRAGQAGLDRSGALASQGSRQPHVGRRRARGPRGTRWQRAPLRPIEGGRKVGLQAKGVRPTVARSGHNCALGGHGCQAGCLIACRHHGACDETRFSAGRAAAPCKASPSRMSRRPPSRTSSLYRATWLRVGSQRPATLAATAGDSPGRSWPLSRPERHGCPQRHTFERQR